MSWMEPGLNAAAMTLTAQDLTLMSNTHRLRIVFISACTPDRDGTGWERRSFSFLKAYANWCDIVLWFVPTVDNPDILRLERLRPYIKFAHILDLPQLTEQLKNPIWRRQLEGADAVHVFRLHGVLSYLRHPCLFLDIDEIPWDLRTDALQAAGPDHATPALRAWRQAENIAKEVIVCSDLERSPAIHVTRTVPNVYDGVQIKPDAPEIQPPEKPILIFVGNLNYWPNLDALSYFYNEIFRHINPSIHLRIVGRSPLNALEKAQFDELARNDDRVEIFYDVEDCTVHYKQALAAIVPLRHGGGTRVKILEAMALRCAVISTSKGCEGLEVETETNILIADEPASFAQACDRLTGDAALRQHLVTNAQETLNRFYSQGTVDQAVQDMLASNALMRSRT